MATYNDITGDGRPNNHFEGNGQSRRDEEPGAESEASDEARSNLSGEDGSQASLHENNNNSLALLPYKPCPVVIVAANESAATSSNAPTRRSPPRHLPVPLPQEQPVPPPDTPDRPSASKRAYTNHYSPNGEFDEAAFLKRRREKRTTKYVAASHHRDIWAVLDGELRFDDMPVILETRSEYLVRIRRVTPELRARLNVTFESCAKDDLLQSIAFFIGKTEEAGKFDLMMVIKAWKPTKTQAIAEHMKVAEFNDALQWLTIDTEEKKMLKIARSSESWRVRVFGVDLPASQEAKYEIFLNAIKYEGWDNDLCAELCPLTEQRFRNSLMAAAASSFPLGHERTPIRVFFIYGPKRTGKTTFVNVRHGEKNVYTQASSDNFFEGYNPARHFAMLIDEIYKVGEKRLEMPVLLKLAEQGMMRLNRKFGSVVNASNCVYFVSNFPPSEWIRELEALDIFLSRPHWIGQSVRVGEKFIWRKGPQLLLEEERYGFVEAEPEAKLIDPELYPPTYKNGSIVNRR